MAYSSRKKSPIEIETEFIPKRTPTIYYSSQLQKETDEILERTRYQSKQQKYFITSCLICCGRLYTCLRMFMPCLNCYQTPFYKQSNDSFGILQKFGRFDGILQQGLNIINPVTDKVVTVSRKTIMIDFQQPVISRDNVEFVIVSVVYFRVTHPTRMLYNLGNKELGEAVKEIGMAGVRTLAGQHTFDELIQGRQSLQNSLRAFCNLNLAEWGIYMQQIFMKDMLLSPDLAESLSMTAKTRRYQVAALLNAQSLVECAKYFSQAAEELNTPAAHQMRYLNLLAQISQTREQKIMMIKMENPGKQ